MPDKSKRFNECEIKLTSTLEALLRKQFQGNLFDTWLNSAEDLLEQGATQGLLNHYANTSLALVSICGIDNVVELSKTLLFVLDHADHEAGLALLANAQVACTLLTEEEGFASWLNSIRSIAVAVPCQVKPVCDKTSTLLSQLDAVGFHRWVAAGMTSTAGDNQRLERYFSLEDPASMQVLAQESSDVRLPSIEKRLSGLMTGLWGLVPTIRAAGVKIAQRWRRASFDENFVRLPVSFSGYRGRQAEDLFKAAITHIGAHRVFSQKRETKQLKPIQIAIISILEDTRAELLAGREYPGLLRLWRSFHVASGSDALVADSLLARLAHALINPHYRDNHSWVIKGRALFNAAGPFWDDPEDIRRIGVLLGNDLGQMRVQFNSKTYVVQPPYRDDNIGIWDFGNSPPELEEDPDIIHGSFRIEQTDNLNEAHQTQREDQNAQQSDLTGVARVVADDTGIALCTLPEWDYVAASERSDWVTIMEYQPPLAPAHIIDYLLSEYVDTQRRIAVLINQAQVGRSVRLKRQPEGDRLDIDACIQARVDYVAGLSASERIYETAKLLHRDLSILVLLDISESTKDLINGTAKSIFSIERTATALLAHAMEGVGDPFAIRAFCSDGRHDLRYYRIKDFETDYDNLSKGRLAGIKPGLSTRMGAALRYAGSEINQQQTHRRLVLVITDGEPSDVDVDDRKYLIEDARKAVHELARDGINAFAVGLDRSGDSYLSRIFGQRNVIHIDRVENLPEQLPMLYFRLLA